MRNNSSPDFAQGDNGLFTHVKNRYGSIFRDSQDVQADWRRLVHGCGEVMRALGGTDPPDDCPVLECPEPEAVIQSVWRPHPEAYLLAVLVCHYLDLRGHTIRDALAGQESQTAVRQRFGDLLPLISLNNHLLALLRHLHDRASRSPDSDPALLALLSLPEVSLDSQIRDWGLLSESVVLLSGFMAAIAPEAVRDALASPKCGQRLDSFVCWHALRAGGGAGLAGSAILAAMRGRLIGILRRRWDNGFDDYSVEDAAQDALSTAAREPAFKDNLLAWLVIVAHRLLLNRLRRDRRASGRDLVQDVEDTRRQFSLPNFMRLVAEWKARYAFVETYFRKASRPLVKYLFACLLYRGRGGTPPDDATIAAKFKVSESVVAGTRRRLRQRLAVIEYLLDVAPHGDERTDDGSVLAYVGEEFGVAKADEPTLLRIAAYARATASEQTMVLALAVRLLDEAMALVIAARLACPSGPTEVDAEARVRRLVRLVAGDDGVRLDRLMRRLLSVCEWTRSEDNRRKLATCHSPQALWAKHRPKSYASVSTAPPEWVAAVQMFRGPVLYLILCREERDPELVMGILEVQTELGRAAVLALLKELI